jgi:hypothetical protein
MELMKNMPRVIDVRVNMTLIYMILLLYLKNGIFKFGRKDYNTFIVCGQHIKPTKVRALLYHSVLVTIF